MAAPAINLKERAKRLKTDIPALMLALKDKETPLIAKVLAGVTVAYALSPIDLIPDFIPVLGYLDDVLLLPGLIALTVRLIPGPVFARCRESAARTEAAKGKKWYYAIPIALLWLLVLGWLVWRLFLC